MGRYSDKTGHATPERWSRDWIIVLLFAAFLAAIVANLIYIQVIKGPEYASKAAMAHTADQAVPARRGTIYDRNGEVMASNVDAVTISVNPQEVTDAQGLARVLAETLGPTTGKSYEDYFAIVDQPELAFAYVLKRGDVSLADELKEKLEAAGIEGIHYSEDTKRMYPNDEVGSQIVGTVKVDEARGNAGLELQYDGPSDDPIDLLKGVDGSLKAERGRKDIPIASGQKELTAAVDGIDIVTSVDLAFQKYCEEALLKAIEGTEAQGGTITVMDASNGEIYAACSYAKKSDEELEADVAQAEKDARAQQQAERGATSQSSAAATDPSADPASDSDNNLDDVSIDVPAVSSYKLEAGKLGSINDAYEPGSTFKPFTAYAVLANNEAITPSSTYTVPYALEVYDTTITDSHEHETENMTLTKILADSSNTGTTLVSREVSTSQLYDAYKAFGFGAQTNCDFPGDNAGQLEASGDWDGVQSATVTFGQGLTVTPLQIVRAYAALEQGGTMVTPHFLIDVPGNPELASELTEKLTARTEVADPEVCAEVCEMLTHVVTEGTGAEAAIDGFTVAGKTGTAEIASAYGGYEENAYIMSFCGWLYGSTSDLICLVTIDRPLTDLGGGGVCGPVFADVMSFAAKRYQIDPQGD